jgi:hypothetical protein
MDEGKHDGRQPGGAQTEDVTECNDLTNILKLDSESVVPKRRRGVDTLVYLPSICFYGSPPSGVH